LILSDRSTYFDQIEQHKSTNNTKHHRIHQILTDDVCAAADFPPK